MKRGLVCAQAEAMACVGHDKQGCWVESSMGVRDGLIY